MKKIEIRNTTQNNIIASQGIMADTFLRRLKGLLGKTEISDDEALCIKPCKSVHTFFMRFPIDVIFIDRENKVINITKSLKPFKTSKYIKNAMYVIEIGAGMSEIKDVRIGDKVGIILE